MPRTDSLHGRFGMVGAGLSLLALGLAALSGCQHNEVAGETRTEAPLAVPAGTQLHTVALRPWPRVVVVQGSLLGDERVVVGAKVAGRVKEVRVDLGSIVQPGDELVRLETEDFDLRAQQAEAQLEQVRAQLGLRPGDSETTLDRTKVPSVLQEAAVRDEAKANLDRATELARKEVISAEELLEREAAFQVAQSRYSKALYEVDGQLALLAVRRAELALARQAQADAVIRAPFKGIVEQRHTAPGAYLQVGNPVVSLVRTDPLRFHGGVPEREALLVRAGQRVRIRVEGHPTVIETDVDRLSPSLDLANRALAVQADVPNRDLLLRAGLFAQAEVVVDPDAKTLAVPAEAVTEFAGVEKVWVVRDGQLEARRVETGRRSGDWVEIRGNLAAGETIVAKPSTLGRQE
ncbi:MAG: efflux RND transporter periplasmic adaptor subunit [Thermoguttaceae bacterium]|jgi:RND family efflux transporter MFP subunit|nr:efflux RND transporter periplasmic adaptor subunit [Thermoguttaceae bacterium]